MKARIAPIAKTINFPDSNAWLVARILASFGIGDTKTVIFETERRGNCKHTAGADSTRLRAGDSCTPHRKLTTNPGDRNHHDHPSLGGEQDPPG